MRQWILVLVLTLTMLVPVPTLATQEAAAPAETAADQPVTLEDLTWLVGHWRGDPPGGGLAEEVWTAPSAGAMMGSFRWTREDKVVVYEFLLLEETSEGLVLRLRHFSVGSKAWEGKEEPLSFHLTEGSRQGAAFETRTDNGWLRLRMRPEGDTGLVVVLEREGGGPLEFRYQRAVPQPRISFFSRSKIPLRTGRSSNSASWRSSSS